MSDEKIMGLIAGADRLPVIVARGMKSAGYRIVCVGIEDNVNSELREIVDFYHGVALARFGGWIKSFRKQNVSRVIMVGKIEKSKAYATYRFLRYLPDWRVIRVWYWRLRKKDKRGNSLLSAIADELASAGIFLEDSTMFNKNDLADFGPMTKKKPGAAVLSDIQFGIMIAKLLGRADVGQSITVRERETVAVEALEGTAKMLKRTGELCGVGWTLVKVSKPEQDPRFDVPCIGIDTVISVATSGGVCIAVEAGKTFIIDKARTLELAEKEGIIVYGFEAEAEPAVS
jgi:DUF1009 family protein